MPYQTREQPSSRSIRDKSCSKLPQLPSQSKKLHRFFIEKYAESENAEIIMSDLQRIEDFVDNIEQRYPVTNQSERNQSLLNELKKLRNIRH